MILNINKDITNHYEFNDYTRKITDVILKIENYIDLVAIVKTYIETGQVLFSERYILTAGKSEMLKRDANTGNIVYKYIAPENTIIKYVSKGILLPHNGTEFSDWEKGNNGEYYINPDFENAINEKDFYAAMFKQQISVYTLIDNVLTELNSLGRFDFKEI